LLLRGNELIFQQSFCYCLPIILTERQRKATELGLARTVIVVGRFLGSFAILCFLALFSVLIFPQVAIWLDNGGPKNALAPIVFLGLLFALSSWIITRVSGDSWWRHELEGSRTKIVESSPPQRRDYDFGDAWMDLKNFLRRIIRDGPRKQ